MLSINCECKFSCLISVKTQLNASNIYSRAALLLTGVQADTFCHAVNYFGGFSFLLEAAEGFV